MIPQIVGGILRAVMAAYGGKLVEQGFISSDQLTQIIGAVLVLVTIGWSAWQKSRAHTTPGGPFNPKAEIRRGKRAGYVNWPLILSLSAVAAMWVGLSLFAVHWICPK